MRQTWLGRLRQRIRQHPRYPIRYKTATGSWWSTHRYYWFVHTHGEDLDGRYQHQFQWRIANRPPDKP